MKPKTPWIAVLSLLSATLVFVGEGNSADKENRVALEGPKKALGINDPAVTNYGVRVRVTDNFIDRGKRAAVNILGKWSEPVSVKDSNFYSEPGGFNELLDPGYDPAAKSAGGVRTTPLQPMWAWRTDCAGGGGLDASCKTPRDFQYLSVRKRSAPGTACNQDDIIPLATNPWCTDNVGASVGGGVLCNQRGVPAVLQPLNQEHGFFVTQDDACYYALVLCTFNGSGYCSADTCSHPQRNELGKVCELAPLDASDLEDGYATVGVHLFPNSLVESAGGGPDAAWLRPNALNHTAAGDYFGYVPTKSYGSYVGAVNNPHGYRTNTLGERWAAGNFPTQGAYDETRPYDKLYGSYFRPGDDIAFYADTRNMQIHSIDRDCIGSCTDPGDGRGSTEVYGPEAVAGCGYGPVYTGQVDPQGDPIYFYDRVPQCLRPKSYWDASKKKWVACNAYDTFLADGVTFNPDRDDNKVIYPGDNAGLTCGQQTTPLSPLTSGGQGTGWSGLRIDSLTLNPKTAAAANRNSIGFNISGDEWRLEAGIMLDFATECQAGQYGGCGSRPGYQVKRRWAMGAMMVDSVNMAGKVKLYSVDDLSCGTAAGGCSDPWGPANDGLVRPDRFHIGLDLNPADVTVALHAGENRFRAIYSDTTQTGDSCLANHSYAGCLIRLGRNNAQSEPVFQLIIQQFPAEFEKQFSELINGEVDKINESLPNLSALLKDPWDFGNALIDVGLFIAGSDGDKVTDDPNNVGRNLWEVDLLAGPAAGDEILSLNLSLGFRPIAFRPPNANGVLMIDNPADGLLSDSFFAKPTLYYPDTRTCELTLSGASYAPVWMASGSGTAYTYTSTGGNNGQLTALGVNPIVANLNKFFFDRGTWQWSKITNLYINSFYQIDRNRAAAFDGGNWGISDGWITLTFGTGANNNINNVRVGDLFWHAATPNIVYPIKGVNTASSRVQLDLDAAIAHKTQPLMNGAAWVIKSRRCSRDASLYGDEVTTGEYDYGDWVKEGSFTDPQTGEVYSGTSKQVVKPYWMAPYKTAPSWCMTPSQVKAENDLFPSLYPQTTWLSFGPNDTPPAGSGMVNPNPTRHTLGTWNTIPGSGINGSRAVVQANQNNYSVKEGAAIAYDASLHVHQRTLNQLAHAVVASGAACLEFAPTDPDTGEETPWASFLTTDRFAAFMPEIKIKYPGAKVKVRIAPQAAPRIRTGVGNLNYTPTSVDDAPVVNEPYTLGAALPNLQLSVVVEDPETAAEIPVFKMNWNTVVGLYLRAMRQCHAIDPLNSAPECLSTDPFVRTISGYWQLYVDYGNDSLASYFEPPINTIDGFAAGRFSNSQIVCPSCTEPVPAGQGKFEVLEAYCGEGCNALGLAQSIVTLLDSSLSMYVSTRASTDFLTPPAPESQLEKRIFDMDFLYIGPDGPDDDGVGTSASFLGSHGDYLGFYFRQFGELDISNLMSMLGAPPSMTLKAATPELEGARYITNNSPRLSAGVRSAPGAAIQSGLYTYRVDGGFWRTPRSAPEIQLTSLTEGRHVLEIRALRETSGGMIGQLAPTRMEFAVDSLPPEISIPPAEAGFYSSAVPIKAVDLQTPADELFAEYAIDDGEWRSFNGEKVSLSRVKSGRHTLRVRVTDHAGNTGEAAREIVVRESAGCGGCASTSDDSLALLLLAAVLFAARRRMLRQRG